MTQQTTAVDGEKVSYLRFGSGDETILMLHGWGASSQHLEPLAQELSMRLGRQVIVPDLPGFGGTPLPGNMPGWTTHDYERWLEKFLDVLEIKKAVFYGHSFGCRILVRLMLASPQRVEKAILTGAAGIKWPLTLRQRLGKFGSRLLGPLKRWIPEKLRQWLLRKVFKAHDWADVSPVMKQTLQNVLAEDDFRDALPDIHRQVLLIWGAHDGYTPLASAHVFAEKLPSATLQVIEDGRHGIHHTHRDQVCEWVEAFLDEA